MTAKPPFHGGFRVSGVDSLTVQGHTKVTNDGSDQRLRRSVTYDRAVVLLGVKIVEEISIGDFVVGVSTIVMAVLTGFLAWQTRRSVLSAEDEIRLTTDQVRISRQTMEAQSRPFLVPTDSVDYMVTLKGEVTLPVQFLEFDGKKCFVFRLWNVGIGPAIVNEISMRVDGRECLEPLDEQVLIDVNIGVSDQRRPLRIAESLATEPGTLRIKYADASGVVYSTESDYEVRENGVFRFLSYVQTRHDSPVDEFSGAL